MSNTSAVESLDLLFRSRNDIPVERAVVRAEEWAKVLQYINYLERQGAGMQPVPMLLFCPECGTQHIDAPEEPVDNMDVKVWTNPPHRSHLCHNCNCIWRPADVPTVGVASINTRGAADNWNGPAPSTRSRSRRVLKSPMEMKNDDQGYKQLELS